MSRQVLKYRYRSDEPFTIPVGAEFVHFGADIDDRLCVWAIFDDACAGWSPSRTPRMLHLVMTGVDIPPGVTYLATATNVRTAVSGLLLVVHLFAEPSLS